MVKQNTNPKSTRKRGMALGIVRGVFACFFYFLFFASLPTMEIAHAPSSDLHFGKEAACQFIKKMANPKHSAKPGGVCDEN